MASLSRLTLVRRLIKPSILTNTRNLSRSSAVLAVWNKDWMPGPYPKTQAEREKAAKKYNLRVEDYEPYPDDGQGLGDYPKLPPYGAESRDPYVNWDIPDAKRNYGEPVNRDADVYVEDRYNPTTSHRYSFAYMFGVLATVMSVLLTLHVTSMYFPLFQPMMPVQYPYNDVKIKGAAPVKHYTFEPVE